MSEILMGVIAGLKLAVFTVLLIYISMIQWASDADWRLYQVAALAFVVMALGETFFVAAQLGETHGVFQWFESFANVRLWNNVLYIVAGTSIAVWQRGYLQELTEA